MHKVLGTFALFIFSTLIPTSFAISQGNSATQGPSCNRSEIYDCIIIGTYVPPDDPNRCYGEIGEPRVTPCVGCPGSKKIFSDCSGGKFANLSICDPVGGCKPSCFDQWITFPNGQRARVWADPRPKVAYTCGSNANEIGIEEEHQY